MLKLQDSTAGTPMNRKARRAARRQGKKDAGRILLTRSEGALTSSQKQLLNQALAHQNDGKLPEAEACYRRGLAADPNCAASHFGIGLVARLAENPDAAYPYFKQAVVLDPENATYWSELGSCLSKIEQHHAAAIAFENAIARKQDDVVLLTNAAWAFYRDDRVDLAFQTYEQALKIDPRNVQALFGLGQQHFSLGDLDEAKKCFSKALKSDPSSALAFFRLVDLSEDPDELSKLLKGIARAASGAEKNEQTARLHFAAGKACGRLKQHDDAFAQFATGNAILRSLVQFDREDVRTRIDGLIEAFQPDVFETLSEAATDSAQPVFIVGMPRSGSTLVEQILSSHPDVEDAGELTKLWNTACYLKENGGAVRYPRDIARFQPGPLAELGADYLKALRQGRSNKALRITDKLLGNFLHVGLIGILFPNAAIVHCRRDPMDSCLSSFTQMFQVSRDLAYTNDLTDLGFYYRQCERLMAHWREVLPKPMLEIEYEVMVANQEEVSRRLIEHVGLPWSDSCLEFYNTKRNVQTASYMQVRKPIYTSSVESWRKYEEHLSPLREALDQFAPA